MVSMVFLVLAWRRFCLNLNDLLDRQPGQHPPPKLAPDDCEFLHFDPREDRDRDEGSGGSKYELDIYLVELEAARASEKRKRDLKKKTGGRQLSKRRETRAKGLREPDPWT